MVTYFVFQKMTEGPEIFGYVSNLKFDLKVGTLETSVFNQTIYKISYISAIYRHVCYLQTQLQTPKKEGPACLMHIDSKYLIMNS